MVGYWKPGADRCAGHSKGKMLSEWIGSVIAYGFVERDQVFRRNASLDVVDAIKDQAAPLAKDADTVADLIPDLLRRTKG